MMIGREALHWLAGRWGRHAGLALLIVLAFGSGIDSFFDSESLAQILDVLEVSTSSALDVFRPLPGYSKFRPLLAGYFYLYFHVFGLNPLPYHVSNLVAHFVSVLLMYKVVGRLTRDTRVALIAATLFAVWYTHGKTVHWVEVYANMAGGAFSLLSLNSYIGFRKTGLERKYCASLLSFLIGLFFIGEAGPAVLALVIPLYDVLYSRERTWKARIGLLPRWAYLFRIGPYAIADLALLWVDRSFLASLHTGPLRFFINANTFLSHLYYPFGPQGIAKQLEGPFGSREILARLLLSGRLWSVLLMLLLSTLTAIWVLYLLVRGSQVERFYAAWFLASPVPLIPLAGIDPRYFYFPLMAFTPLVAIQATKVWAHICAQQRTTLVCTTAPVLVLCGIASIHALYNVRMGVAFRELGGIVRDVTNGLSQTHKVFPPNSDLYFVSLPTISPIGIHIFGGHGLGQYVRWKYGDRTLKVYEVDQWPDGCANDRRRFIFYYQDGRLLEAPVAEVCP